MAPKKTPVAEILPNVDLDNIASQCKNLQNHFILELRPLVALYDDLAKTNPDTHKLLEPVVEPLIKYAKEGFTDIAWVCGEAVSHGWERGHADGTRTGMLSLLKAQEEMIKGDVFDIMSRERWLEMIKTQRQKIDETYLKFTGGIKVKWNFDDEADKA